AAPGTALADEHTFQHALLTIPPKYLADIPRNQRNLLLEMLSTDRNRLDLKHEWLHWYSDGGDVRGTSMAWAKELPRPNKSPLIFVHMPKPFAKPVIPPGAEQTIILERQATILGMKWRDVTQQVMPEGVDRNLHFRSRREDTTIEAGEWNHVPSRDGAGKIWTFGTRVADLHWNGERFEVRKPASKKLTESWKTDTD
ncbi:MAG: hypothetical protein JWL81_3382, partial [Verrucomicrobiales bacterium]|nr:hypothetical protein [Verrucomicrobiales bacterium]